MGFAMPLLAIAGPALSAIGQVNQGFAASKSASYQSQVAANNAAIAAQNARLTMETGAAKEAAQGMKSRATVGHITAAEGASGIDVNTGSAAAVRSAAAELGELDAMTIRSNSAREAYGYKVQESNELAQSQLLKKQAESAKTGGILAGLGSLVSGVSGVGSKFASWSNTTGGATGGGGDPWAGLREEDMV